VRALGFTFKENCPDLRNPAWSTWCASCKDSAPRSTSTIPGPSAPKVEQRRATDAQLQVHPGAQRSCW